MHAGDYITADMKIVCQIDNEGNPMEETLKYTVEKVVGEIKNSVDYRQIIISENL